MNVNKVNAHHNHWEDDETDSDFDPSLEGINLTGKDDVLVVGIDFGTTYVTTPFPCTHG